MFPLIRWRSYFFLSTLQRRLREIAGTGALLLLDSFRRNRTAGEATLTAYALRAARDDSGFAAVEFALIMPVLLFFALGALMLGSEFNDFIVITNAAQAGTFQPTVSRGANTPYTATVKAVKDSTYLSASKLAQLTRRHRSP